MNSRKELIKRLTAKFGADEQVLAVVQVGSTAKGYDDEHSDVDLELVVTEDKYDELAKKSQKIIHTESHDLIFTTIDKLRQLKVSNMDEDHWNYQNANVLIDKTHILQKTLNEITRYNETTRPDRLKRYYRAYWENTLSAWSCLEHMNHLGARIYTALTVQELIRLLFNLNHLWSPKPQWALKEIHLLKTKPDKLQTLLESTLEQPETRKLARLWNQTTMLLRKEKHSWVDHPEELL
jgi:predicted nucleotidyltransferase